MDHCCIDLIPFIRKPSETLEPAKQYKVLIIHDSLSIGFKVVTPWSIARPEWQERSVIQLHFETATFQSQFLSTLLHVLTAGATSTHTLAKQYLHPNVRLKPYVPSAATSTKNKRARAADLPHNAQTLLTESQQASQMPARSTPYQSAATPRLTSSNNRPDYMLFESQISTSAREKYRQRDLQSDMPIDTDSQSQLPRLNQWSPPLPSYVEASQGAASQASVMTPPFTQQSRTGITSSTPHYLPPSNLRWNQDEQEHRSFLPPQMYAWAMPSADLAGDSGIGQSARYEGQSTQQRLQPALPILADATPLASSATRQAPFKGYLSHNPPEVSHSVNTESTGQIHQASDTHSNSNVSMSSIAAIEKYLLGEQAGTGTAAAGATLIIEGGDVPSRAVDDRMMGNMVHTAATGGAALTGNLPGDVPRKTAVDKICRALYPGLRRGPSANPKDDFAFFKQLSSDEERELLLQVVLAPGYDLSGFVERVAGIV
ncbi:hypothetical protein EMMF5_004296 [Cystobasidiomycetes sp. EMM_F5]